MQVYVYFVHDDRRDAPVERRMNLHGHDDARRQAERILRETYHHQIVEVWSEGRHFLTIKDGEADAA
ncbi:MAG TPA: hypothetical protein VN694_14595 [Caulobacteraceae bacterium]|nr:hypothetical protein [Caulobacteraceae bacterium]